MKKINFLLTIFIFQLNFIHAMETTTNFPLPDFAKDFFASRVEYSSSNVIIQETKTVILDPFPAAFITKEEFVKTINEFINMMKRFLNQTQKQELLKSNEKKEPIWGYIQKLDMDINQNSKIIGDIHASAHSLLRDLLSNPTFPLICTGDYASRGRYGVETWYVLMKLKIQNPYNVFLLKGNHEIQWIAEKFGLKQEICQKYGPEVFDQMLEVFTLLPSVLYLNCNNNTIQICHGIIPTDEKFNPLITQDTITELMQQKNYATSIIPAFKDLYLGEINSNKKPVINPSIKARENAHSVSMPTIKILLKKSNLGALLRGHDHNQYAVNVKVNEKKELSYGEYTYILEKPIEERTPLISYPAYTLMSCPEGQGDICNVDGYAILTTAERFEDWTLTPFQSRIR